MNILTQLRAANRPEPIVMSPQWALLFGLLAPYPTPAGRAIKGKATDDEPEPSAINSPGKSSALEPRLQAQRARRDEVRIYLVMSGGATTDSVANAMGVNRSTAYDDLLWLRDEAQTVVSVRRSGKLVWRAK